MHKKINKKSLMKKSLIYRGLIILIQILYTYLVINNWKQAITIGWSWNVINLFLFWGYSYLYDKKYSPYVETKGAVIWLTGLPCSGKTTIGDLLAKKLKARGKNVERLDGDVVRDGKLSDDLGFSREDRDKNINRINFVSKLLSRNETIVIASFVSPYRKTRDSIRKNVTNFIEVFVHASPEECARRDVKGMWKKAKEGKIKRFTGHDASYEMPFNSEIDCYTEQETVKESTNKILTYLKERNLL